MAAHRKYKDKATAIKAKNRWINEHNKAVYKAFAIRFFIDKDKDIIDYINAQPEKINFFRQVFREYMENHK